jgi:hypothetical protein
MKDVALSLSNGFIRSIESIFNGDYSDVLKVRLFWHQLKYITFSHFNYVRLLNGNENPPTVEASLIEMFKFGLLPESTLKFYRDNRTSIDENLSIICNDQLNNTADLELDILHELLLNYELNISPDKVKLCIGKTNKDTTGSHYTPKALARAVVNEVFKKYEEDVLLAAGMFNSNSADDACKDYLRHIFLNTSIADLSCGGGEFYRAARSYMLEHYGIQPEMVCSNFWGIDIDPIALQTTVSDILMIAEKNTWPTIISHFLLGNPLVNTTVEGSFSEKVNLFALGHIYSEAMGLDYSVRLNQKRFDIVIGNPPWEKVRFEERKFFKSLCPEISIEPQKDRRKKAIDDLQTTWPALHKWATQLAGEYAAISSRLYSHPYIVKSVSGELNTYALFTELAFELTKPLGVCSLIVKSAVATSPANKKLFHFLMENGHLSSICLFSNNKKLFNIDSREKFCVLTLSHQASKSFEFVAGITTVEDMRTLKRSNYTTADVQVINPFTKMLPSVSQTRDLQTLVEMHKCLPVFEDEFPDCHFGRLVHLTAHADFIEKVQSENNIPIYEGKFIEQYDARFSTFDGLDNSRKYSSKASALRLSDSAGGKPLPVSRFFVCNWLWSKFRKQYTEDFSLCWRSLTSTTNARTAIAMILPTLPTCQSIQMLQTSNPKQLLLLLGLFNSIPFDFFVRLKMPGIDLTQSVIRQIPVPSKNSYFKTIKFHGVEASIENHMFTRLYALLDHEPLLQDLLVKINYPVYPLSVLAYGKEQLRRDLDWLFSIAYGIDEKMYSNILSTFPKYQ